MSGILIADRVWDTTTTTGTGTITLSGTAKTGYQTFLAGIGNGNACYYCISDTTNGAWETGIGTYTDASKTLSRTTILNSSNSNSAVNFAAGTKDVFVVFPAYLHNNRQPVFGARNISIVRASATSLTITPGPFNDVLGSRCECILQDTSANTLRISWGGSVSVSTTGTGAGGIDTGSQAASTWYYIWLIWNGTAISALVSTQNGSSALPTMPSGYTHMLLVGAVYSNGSTQFQNFTQLDNQVWTPTQNVFSSFAMTSTNTWQSQSLSTIVPPIATSVSGLFGSSVSGNACDIAVAGDSNGTGQRMFFMGISPGTSSWDSYFGVSSFADCPIITSQTIYVKADNTSATNRLDVTGWRY